MTAARPPPLWTTWGQGITRRSSPVGLRPPSDERRRPASYTTPRDANAQSPEACEVAGPQAPRDITVKDGTNPRPFQLAGAPAAMNLCNIHFHLGAEHKGPAFNVPAPSLVASKAAHGGGGAGFACNAAANLTAAELKHAGGACKELKPGDTIEVHWVHSSCNVAPGKTLGACLSKDCTNPTLRVEAQVFLVVNDPQALDFTTFDYTGAARNGLHQAKALPDGIPVIFRGSTTGPDYDGDEKCSPMKATWSVRPTCTKVDINSLHKWCEKNAFGEDHGHGVRPLVTKPALLDKIQ